MRSMRSTPTGGRPLPAFGYTGSIRAHSSRHGTTRSISARNCARRVVFAYFSKPVPASVICLRAIITSRGRPLPVSSQHVGLKRERVIQRFPRYLIGLNPSHVYRRVPVMTDSLVPFREVVLQGSVPVLLKRLRFCARNGCGGAFL